MKKLIILCEVLVIVFIAIKFFAVSGVLNKVEGPDISPWFLGMAAAQPGIRALQPQDVDEQLTQERKLLASLSERQQQMESRESYLKAEERRLEDLKKEIIQKIENLKALEEKLTATLDAGLNADEKRMKDLAKVYEAASPQQVGTILEKMDTKMAAGILMRMNSKKAGLVWGFIPPARSVEIAKEITNSQAAAAAAPKP